jgi:lipopolysaccharide transport system permease protein
VQHYLELVWYKALADLRSEASRAYLGALWWVLEPLLYMTVFYLVFGLLLYRGGEGYIAFLLCGLIVWRWFGSCISRGVNAITANSGLMLQVYLPKYLFPLIVIVTQTVKFLFVFALLLVYLIVVEYRLDLAWLTLPVLLVVQFVFTAACTAIVAAVVPFLPDLRILISSALTLLFFMSGIFYDITSFPEQVQFYFQLNPMATLIENYRLVLLEGQAPSWLDLIGVSVVSGAGMALAIYLLVRYDRYYPRIAFS